MKHRIDPKVDCVFKALLGTEDNRNLLVHFLNAILEHELSAPIAKVDILNPYNDLEFIDDKLSIVDVKARDASGQIYQIEIQMLSRSSSLPTRILYNWADIYSQQLQSGDSYSQLKATYSIWLLAENLLAKDSEYVHTYKIRDDSGRVLIDQGGIWLLELEKFVISQVNTEQQRWLQFFKQAKQFNDLATLPEWMDTVEMRQAMNTLRQFSEKEQNYHVYQARQNYLRQQQAMQEELEAERQGKLAAMQREQQAIQEKAAALQEIERLKAQLASVARE